MTELDLIRLPNGVRIAIDPMPGLETAALGVWQRTGARDETPAQNGVAHLFEHMAFKGAGARDAQAFAEAIENVGGAMNAATGYERTAYYARVVAEHAPFALDLIADILFAPHWAPDDLEKEKGVVAQERGEAFDAADDRVFELHQQHVFKDQALGRPILGEAETLAPVTVDALAAFRDAHMTPDNLVISLAGRFDRDAVLEIVAQRFANLPQRAAPRPAAAHPKAGAITEARKLEQAHLAFSWAAPSAADEKTYAHRLMCEIFGGGMSSRLFQEAREKRGLVYAIDAFVDAYEDAGRLCVYAGCDAKNAAEVVRVSRACLESLAAHGPTDAELARARATAGAQILMGAESPAARAEARAGQVFLRDKLVPFSDIRARMQAVTAAEIRDAAQESLAGPACIAVLGPKAGHGAAAAFQAR
ncbi:MAG: insulinase family protein [Alphaproteobacteria bacterium]|nr:insulinase family protein [Alphaproteobacteria bacterium]